MKTPKLPETLEKYELLNNLYIPVAWGYVEKDGNLLVTERFKKDDPLRSGELVLPGGRLKGTETYLEAAQREVLEETGVETKAGNKEKFVRLHEKIILKPREKITTLIEPNGMVWLCYRDSKKSYVGRLFDLKPLTEPKESESESREPRYISISDALNGKFNFTPACQILLEMVGDVYRAGIIRKDDVPLEAEDLRNYLEITKPQ